MLNDTRCARYIEVEEGSYDFDTGNGYTGVVGHFTQVLTLNLHDVIEIVQHLIYSSQKRRLLYLCVGCDVILALDILTFGVVTAV